VEGAGPGAGLAEGTGIEVGAQAGELGVPFGESA
jgi:hypothetical protein